MITITKDYHFKGNILIPNLEGSDPLDLGNSAKLKVFIEDNEPRILILMLGFELYKELLENLNEDGTVKDGSDQKWKDLVNGKDDYLGLIPITSNYIFTEFLQDDESDYGGIGIMQSNSKGGKRYSSREKFVKAWRRFYEHAIGKSSSSQVMVREEEVGIVWNSSTYDVYKPLRIYLDENEELFPNKVSNFSKIKNQNFYGI